VAGFTSIAAVCSSIVRYLDLCFRQLQPITGRNTAVRLVRTEDLNRDISSFITTPSLSVFLYRVDFNKTMRAAWSATSQYNGESHLPLDLHFLLLAWGENADHEYRILGRALQCMENTPIFSGPLLDPTTSWSAKESIQICLEDLSTEDLMRTFDSLPLDYKLSVPYVAKIAVIYGQQSEIEPPVTNVAMGVTAEVEE